jgi:hypothetical protein
VTSGNQTGGVLAVGRLMRLSPSLPMLAVFLFAAAEGLGEGEPFLSVFAVGLAATAAALLSGILLGFLFALPKTVDSGARPLKTRLATNTNLDQISDWLTKILVGLGLVQIGKVTHGVSQLGAALAPGLGGGSGAKAFGVAVLVYSVLDGFLVGYIWTRISLSRRFRLAAEDLEPAEQVTEKVLQTPLPPGPEKAP